MMELIGGGGGKWIPMFCSDDDGNKDLFEPGGCCCRPTRPHSDHLSMDRIDDAPVTSVTGSANQSAGWAGWRRGFLYHRQRCPLLRFRPSSKPANPSSIDSDAAPSSSPSAPFQDSSSLFPRSPVRLPVRFNMPHGIEWGGAALKLVRFICVAGRV